MSGDLFTADEPMKPEENSDYNVGYGKPPRSGQFKPGRSGNPKGRPKGAKSLKTRVENILNAKLPVKTKNGTKKKAKVDIVIEQLTNKSINGDMKATAELIKLLLRLGWADQLGDDVEANAKQTSEEDDLILQRLSQKGLS